VENEVTGEWLGWELDEEVATPVLRLPNYGSLRGFPAVEDVYECRRQLLVALDDLYRRGEA